MKTSHTLKAFRSAPAAARVGMWAVFLFAMVVETTQAGDILRGGAGMNSPSRTAVARSQAGADMAAQAKANAQDRLARTTKALQSVKAMQDAARALAAQSDNAGMDPNNAGQRLPDVRNGLGVGGLETDVAAGWDGANLPTESTSSGRSYVNIRQNKQQALLNWKTFNIGRNTTLNFDQSAGGENKGQWIAFNKVNDPSGRPSQILGQIKADGQVYVINQNGIIFGGASQINVHALVASSLPINDGLVARGVLNNPDLQYLFSALPIAAGSNGTPAFTPPVPTTPDGRIGDVVVQKGARLEAPTSAANIGGRIALVGANVKNEGTISTPDGQTILAAGLQVAMVGHKSDDPSLRGLDVYVGALKTAGQVLPVYAGTATNAGLIDAPRASVFITGKQVDQLGVIDSSTSVTRNGRIDLIAAYDAVNNPSYDPAIELNGLPFLYQSSGSVTLGSSSATRILPEWASEAKDSRFQLRSQINLQGLTVHLEGNAIVLAPNAAVTARAGTWAFIPSPTVPKSTFILSNGQIYLDSGALIDVAGSTDVPVSILQNILSLELRGSELANSPLQRDSLIRATTLTLDGRKTGTYAGYDWIGTPLGDATGFFALIERTVAQYTTDGGDVSLLAGGSVVLNKGSTVDVSGGWINYLGAMVKTTRLLYNGRLVDVADATPDRLYDGIYTATSTRTQAKWGVTNTYALPLSLTGEHYEQSYIHGANGGTITISAPAMALNGTLAGNTVQGPRQLRATTTLSELPGLSSLSLAFTAQDPASVSYLNISPTPPTVVFQKDANLPAVGEFQVDGNGAPPPLNAERLGMVVLSPDLFGTAGFGHLTVENSEGEIEIPEELNLPPGGSLTLSGANIKVGANVTAPNGELAFTAFNISPYLLAALNTLPAGSFTPPTVAAGKGKFTLEKGVTLSTAGLLVDDRLSALDPLYWPLAIDGGDISIESYDVNLKEGSVIDVSGGAAMTARSSLDYGHAGSIEILSGRDPGMQSIIGGSLNLGSTLRGFAGKGAFAGSLTIQAELVRIGDNVSGDAQTLAITPEFFNEGGFGSFTLRGLGRQSTIAGEFLPGVEVQPGTIIAPEVMSVAAVPQMQGGRGLGLREVARPLGERAAFDLSLVSNGVTDTFGGAKIVRGDVVLGEGARIEAGPQGSVGLTGDTVAVLGSIFAPGGVISISGGTSSFGVFNIDQALPTVYLGPNSVLSAAGTFLPTPDPYGRRTGLVLPGGQISVAGNIVAERGALLDVSGASGILDVSPIQASYLAGQLSGQPLISTTSGLNTPLASVDSVPVRVDSDGGVIVLKGGQELFFEGTLLGKAGGPSASGGSLFVSSGRFYTQGTPVPPDDLNLIVTQTGASVLGSYAGAGSTPIGRAVLDGLGNPIAGMGYFGVDSFQNSGMDSLFLGGNVRFSGPVSIKAQEQLGVATGGVIFADSGVTLEAPYVALGTAFKAPFLPEEVREPYQFAGAPYYVTPTFGPGSLTVIASLIDVGNLTLKNIGQASLIADGGDIRGDGTFSMAGDLLLRAGQVYPATGVEFTVAAYDHGGIPGSITVQGSGDRALPLSAGGTLSLYASTIDQQGVLRAPLGTINLGWDGTGTAPKNYIVGNLLALPTAQQITLGSGSVTSVSAVDPKTGEALLVPYGFSSDGNSWIDPSGVDITASGFPGKNITVSGLNVSVNADALLDISGGGDAFAYRWVSGKGGTRDILASNGSFAVVPGYGANYMPYAPFNTSSGASNLKGQPGYVNSALSVGDQVYLDGSAGLPAGIYTLLPARYALLPGAFLVTPQGDVTTGSVAMPDGSSIVSGYRFNGLNAGKARPELLTSFEVAPPAVVAARAQYETYFASSYLKESAQALNATVPRLPQDAGHLILQASQSMSLLGNVSAAGAEGGRGGMVDIASPLDIVIASNSTPIAGKLVLDAAQLSGFGAESLLIGGTRSIGTAGTTVAVKTNNLLVDNAGSALSAPELILVANQSLTVADNAELEQSGSVSGADKLLLGSSATPGSGDGVLLRLSGDASAEILRSGVSSSAVPNLVIGAGARLSGTSLTLDSTSSTTLNPAADLDADYITLNSGRISLQLDNPGALQANPGLVLTGNALQDLFASEGLSMLSYSSLDIYGTGVLTANGALKLGAAEIRGFNNGGGTVSINASSIHLDNASLRTAPGAVAAPAGTLEFNADSFEIGVGQLNIDQFATVNMNIGSGGLTMMGEGGLRAQQALNVVTPFIVTTSKTTQTLAAGGALNVTSPVGGATLPASASLGSSLTLEGASVTSDTNIILPSGLLTLHAMSGDLNVGGLLYAAGTAQNFYDYVKYTDAGQVTLKSDTGSVNVAAGSVINISAAQEGGDAGTLAIATPQGGFALGGTLLATGNTTGVSGSFVLDVGSLASLGAINNLLNNASFNESRVFRIRNGNVLVDGLATSHEFVVSADGGSINVTGTIDASGETGGTIDLRAKGSVVLEAGSLLSVAAQDFDNAGKGGAVSLEAGSAINGVSDAAAVVDIRTNSTIDLRVASKTAQSANLGRFSGTLHLRAPQNATQTDLQVNAINGTILDASSIVVEGYRIYDLADIGGTITSAVQAQILTDGQNFLGAAGTTTAQYTDMANRLLANNAGLADVTVIAPGAELMNATSPVSETLSLNATNSTIVIATTGGSIIFPSGTPGNNMIRSSTAATVTSATGVVTNQAAGSVFAVAPGSTVTLAAGGTVTFASGTGGAMPVTLTAGSSFTTSAANSVATVTSRGSTVTLNTANSSGVNLAAGSVVTLPNGTPGNNTMRATMAGTVTAPNGTVTAFAANTTFTVSAGSRVALNAAGTLTFASGSGGAVAVALNSGSFTTVGATSVTPVTGNIVLGSATSTETSDWSLANYRFGPKGAAGVLTLRATNNLVFFNALSDGFTSAAFNASLLNQNILLPVNAQSWSYRLVAGADLSAADFQQVRPLSSIATGYGSILIGKNNGTNISNSNGTNNTAGNNALTSLAVQNRFQTIRTGSGSINLSAGRDVQLLNQFSTIYTAGTKVVDATMGGTFDVPILDANGSQITLGAIQESPVFPAQYTMGGGNVSIYAQNDIARYTKNTLGQLIADSERQLPVNWLYRRGYVNPATGEFGAARFGDIASTSWWVDFSNYFEGVATFGGGNLSMVAGRDISNVDGSVATNARMTKGNPETATLVELGGGDLTVQAGRDIDAGVYYVERGQGVLEAGNSIKTNSTRSPSLGAIRVPAEIYSSETWLPTTLFLGKGSFNVSARGDVLLGPIANPFLLPEGYSNTYWYKTYFSTYDAASSVEVSSIGGDVTLRTAATLPSGSSAEPLLQIWLQKALLLNSQSAAFYQPWLRLNETSVTPFALTSSIMPGTLKVAAFSGNINLAGDITLSPSATGTLELLANGSINGLQPTGQVSVNSVATKTWGSSVINVSDADPSSIPGVTSPFAYQTVVGILQGQARQTGSEFLAFVDNLFQESGSTTGDYAVLQTKQALHAPGILHANDTEPVRLYSGGSISGLTLFSPKFTHVFAADDITDISFYLQNATEDDLSIVSSGGDIIPYNANTPLRTAARATGNMLNLDSGTLAGDIQIGGAGSLTVLAGGTLDLGTGSNNADGTGLGITSLGNARNPYLSFAGASLFVGAGLGYFDFDTTDFLSEFGDAAGEAGATGSSDAEKNNLALEAFFNVLRDAGRAGEYENGFAAIDALFGKTSAGGGDVLTRSRDIRTKSGGDIFIVAPGGGLTMADSAVAETLAPPGIITESGGNISIFTYESVSIGIGRIFTLRGGNEIIWSSTGDIAAGDSSKTVQSAPPTRVLIDPQSGDVKTDLAGLGTGGGIGVLATVEGVEPGDVDLIAPVGVVDAGDAGIRVSGNLNIAATQVLNAGNISTGGTSTGVPSAPTASAPNTAGITAASSATAAGASAANNVAQQANKPAPVEEAPSVISVEVLGYGGGEEDEDDDRRRQSVDANGSGNLGA